MEVIKGWFNRGRRAYRVLSDHRFTTVAGTLVFFLIISFVPLTFFLMLLLGRLNVNTDELLNLPLFGWAKEMLLFFRENAAGKHVGIFFLITTFWSSSSFFYHLRRSGEIIYRYRRVKQGWKVRVAAFALTVLIVLFLGACAAGLLAVIFFTRLFPRWIAYPIVYSFVLVVGFFTAWLLNWYLCPYRVSFRDTAQGSLYTAVAWLVASIAFSVYLALSNKEKLYGALSAVIVFLLWLYWIMTCFTAGVVYNCRRVEVRRLEHKKY